MALIGPQGATALASGFNAQGLIEQLRQKALQNQGAQMEVEQARRQQLGQQLVAEALAGAMGRRAPAATTRMQPMKPGAAPMATADGKITSEPLAAPAGGGSTPPADSGTPAAPQPSSGSPAPPAAAPAQPQKKFTWRDVLEDITRREDVDPGVKFAAMSEIEKQLAAEEAREAVAYQKDRDREARLSQHMSTLQWRYDREQNETERLKLKGEIDRTLEEMRGLSRERVARISGDYRMQGIAAANASREKINAAKLATQEGLAQAKLAYQKEFDAQNLDLKADSAAKNYLLKSRELDLRDKGLDQQQARFVAKMEQDKAIAEMRDATTRRGQDLTVQRAQMAIDGKLKAEEAKVASTMPTVVKSFDDVYRTAEELLNEPGLESATGPIQSWLPTVRDDTADFEAKLTALKAMVGFQALADMRRSSPTGGALGNVSNKEVEFLQNTIAALSLSQSADQFRENLMKIMDNANRGKALTLQAYETRFGNKAAGGPPPANPLSRIDPSDKGEP